MDRQAQLIRIAGGLGRAGKSGDWLALRRLDAELAGLLAAMAADGSPNIGEQRALEEVCRVHAACRAQCAQESSRLEGRLTELRAHKEGWLAYAQHDGWQEVPA